MAAMPAPIAIVDSSAMETRTTPVKAAAMKAARCALRSYSSATKAARTAVKASAATMKAAHAALKAPTSAVKSAASAGAACIGIINR